MGTSPCESACEPPNGVSLSCGAGREYSQTEGYLRKRGADSFRRVLGSSSLAPLVAALDHRTRSTRHSAIGIEVSGDLRDLATRCRVRDHSEPHPVAAQLPTR